MSEKTELNAVWCDLTHLGDDVGDVLLKALQTPASGVLLTPRQLPSESLPDRVRTAVLVRDAAELAGVDTTRPVTFVATDHTVLRQLPATALRGLWIDVADAGGMNAAVTALDEVDLLIISFRDQTNIPLELVLAEAQSRVTTVIKQVGGIEDAVVTKGVLQHGPDAVLLRTETAADLAAVAKAFEENQTEQVDLVPAEVVEARSIGMGMRGCVDTAALFAEDEGMLVGSTSSGGLLVCAEVHYLPYMNLRPFRVNAGAVHSYVWTPANRTAYITDLSAGEPVLAVSTSGRARPLVVGRIKTEMRPLRLISCRVEDRLINTIVQDDWHVRLFGADGSVRNSTSIVPGDQMLAVAAKPGRHVGIAVDESIVEV